MKATSRKVDRFEPMHAWANRILRVDLSDMRVDVRAAVPYVPDLIGARGIAARVCWEEYPEPCAGRKSHPSDRGAVWSCELLWNTPGGTPCGYGG